MSVFGLWDYGRMIADPIRMEGYTEALRRAVMPGCTVLDIGTGTGIFAMLACRFGAGHVYAVEPSEAVEVGREVAGANGLADRITFVRDLSTRVTLPRRADVIISDLRDILPLNGHHIPSLADARARHLAPGGVLIPQRDTLWASVLDDAEVYAEVVGPWRSDAFGLDLTAAHRRATGTWRKRVVSAGQLLVEPRRWGTLDYTRVADPDLSADLAWVAPRDGTAHGLVLWFDTELGSGVSFSNAPGGPQGLYGNAVFPLAAPTAVTQGDTIEVTLRAKLVGDDYVWVWNTRVWEPGASGRVRASHKQSTLLGVPMEWLRLRNLAEDHPPALTDDGEVERFVLEQMDGRAPLGEIARRLQAHFPERFARRDDALGRVRACSYRYGRTS